MGEGDDEFDVILFQAPPEECRLFVSNVPTGTQLDTVWDVFGTIGPVCEVALLNEARDGLWLVVSYFLPSHARAARRRLDRAMVNGRQIAVTKSHGGALRAPLPARKAIELANYLFTPCGWSSAVRHLELHDAGETDSGDVSLLASARVDLRVHGWCRVEGCGQHTARGEGVGPAVKTAYKGAISNALRDALSQLCVVLVDPPSPSQRPRVHVSVLERGSLGALGLLVANAPSRSEGVPREARDPGASDVPGGGATAEPVPG